MFCGFTFLSFLVALFGSVTAVDRNVTIDDLDRNVVLSPLDVWAWSDEGSALQDGTFSFSNNENATVSFTFPMPATAVFWQGFKRSGSALYSVCIDCPPNADNPSFIAVDAHASNVKPDDPAVILFAKTGLTNALHNVTIKNHFDPRFSSVSQITIDAFILTISNDSSSTPNTPVSTSMPAGPSQTVAPPAKHSTPLSSSSSSALFAVGSPAFIGVIVTCLVIVVAAASTLLWWLYRNRKLYNRIGNVEPFYPGKTVEPASPMIGTLDALPRDAEQSTMVSAGYTGYPDNPFARPNKARRPSPLQRLSSHLSPSIAKAHTALVHRASYILRYPSTVNVDTQANPSPAMTTEVAQDVYRPDSTGSGFTLPMSTHSLYSAPTPGSIPQRFLSTSSTASNGIGLSNPFSGPDDPSESYPISPVLTPELIAARQYSEFWERQQSPGVEPILARTSMQNESQDSVGTHGAAAASGAQQKTSPLTRDGASVTFSVPSPATIRARGLREGTQDVVVPESGRGQGRSEMSMRSPTSTPTSTSTVTPRNRPRAHSDLHPGHSSPTFF